MRESRKKNSLGELGKNYREKEKDGLGVKNIEKMNTTLLVIWRWRIVLEDKVFFFFFISKDNFIKGKQF